MNTFYSYSIETLHFLLIQFFKTLKRNLASRRKNSSYSSNTLMRKYGHIDDGSYRMRRVML